MTPAEERKLARDLAKIEERLAGIEDVMSFMVKASQRFKKGDRVEFNAKADKRLISERRKGGVRTGTVQGLSDGWTMTVLLDGYKKPREFHHSFFDKVKRKRKSTRAERTK